ncbi:hypothetical protein ATK36_3839 [Amycolatopsis sulphurea]|uniref:Uncharacterized protein n=1 Tax=Amycolatopsis sulphurea TaxID=76022 RepID=A0A2A9FDA8_9PSEU|nr:hypothetical protein [Amycolatopsis sulphurea]PFG48731.1 hypothetical protein ATK36_3839 [Amycolatopsis sulphurea]
MVQPNPYQPAPRSGENAEQEVHRGIRTIRLAITGQAVLYLALAVLVGYLATRTDDAGSVVWPLVIISVNTVLLIALVVCSVLLGRRERAIAMAIIWLECAFMAVLLISTILSLTLSKGSGGAAGAPVGLILWGFLMQSVLRPWQKPEMRAAFGMRPIRPRQPKSRK